MKPTFVTLEPNESNKDAVALTIYFKSERGLTLEVVEQWLQGADRDFNLPLWVDTSDPHFEVVETQEQPFLESVRYQAHPTT